MMLSLNPHCPSYRPMFVGLLILLVAAPFAAYAAQYGGGDGTEANPFLISTAQEFAMIGENPGDWSKYFELVVDIDLSDCNETNLPMIGKWVLAGSAANRPFNGTFEGNGKTIWGFHYKDMQSDYVGLFQYVTGRITNLELAGATVTGNGLGTGALVGYLGKGSLTGCSATGIKVSGNLGVGALVGVADGNVHTSRSNGSVSGVQFVGGLVGQVGDGTVARSYSRAKVVGNEDVGGLIGVMLKQTSILESCYATGSVSGAVHVGGLVGGLSSGSVWRSYSVGGVTGTQSSGGLIGYKWASGEVYVSFWDTETSHQATSAAGTGKTTTEMKTFDTYSVANWDFPGTWVICEGLGYPVFLWQLPVGDFRCPDGVNFVDFASFAAYWRHDDCGALNYSCMGTDLDGSGAVDPRDLAIFAANWMAGVD